MTARGQGMPPATYGRREGGPPASAERPEAHQPGIHLHNLAGHARISGHQGSGTVQLPLRNRSGAVPGMPAKHGRLIAPLVRVEALVAMGEGTVY